MKELMCFRSLASWGNWTLALFGGWFWLPVRGGQLIGATLTYQRLYGQRWWPIVQYLYWGPFQIIHRLPQGFGASNRACSVAELAAENRSER